MPSTLHSAVPQCRTQRRLVSAPASPAALAILGALCNLLWLAAWLGGAASWLLVTCVVTAATAALACAVGLARVSANQATSLPRILTALDAAVRPLDARLFDWDLGSNMLHIDDTRLARCTGARMDAEHFLSAVLHPQDQAAVRAQLGAALHNGESFQIECRVLHADASLHSAQLQGRVLRAADGAAVRVVGFMVDIDRQEATRRTLETQTRQLDRWFESYDLAARAADLGVWDWDLVSNTLATDQNMLRTFDRESASPASNAQAFLHDIVHPEDRTAYFSVVMAAVKNRSLTELEHRFRYIRGNGEVRHAQLVGRLIRDANGRATRLLGVTWNITAQVVATEEIARKAAAERDLLERLNLATQLAGITVWEWDLLADRIVMEADVARRYGADQTRANGNALSRIRAAVHPDDLAGFDASSAKAIQSPEPLKNRYRICRVDGEYRHVETITRIFRDAQGKAIRLLGVTRDVSDEVEHAQQLARQALAERALTDRLSIASEAAGISTWEICLRAQAFLWVENPIRELGEVFNERPTSLAQFARCVHPEDQQALPNALRQAFAHDRGRISCNFRALDSDGNVIHVVVHGRLVPDAEGRMVRLLGVSWNNTREVQTAQILEEQARTERMLRTRISVSTQAAGISSWELDLVQHRMVWHENLAANVLAEGSDDVLTAIARLQHPDDRDAFRRALREALRNGESVIKYRYRLRHGADYAHCQNFARLVFDERGCAITAIGVTWDITKEVQAAQEIERQAQQLRNIERRLERASLSSSEGHFEWDLFAQTAWYSSSFHALLGYAEESLPGDLSASLALLQLPEDVHWQRVKFDAHIERGQPYKFETQLRTARGELRWFKVLGTAERDARGRAVRMAGAMHDIHQQRLAEDALQLAQQRLERAITGTQDGLWELEASGAAWCSPRVAELLDFGADELPEDTHFLKAFLHADDRDAVAAATVAHFHQAAPYDLEIRLQTKGGEYRWYRTRASAERDARQQPLRLSGSLQDVTEARAAREALVEATEAAQAASRAKSDFLANVSHEIRTPMNGIIGMTHLLLETALDGAQQECAEIIRSSADSLLIIINDILDFSKVEAGKLSIERLQMDLRAQVEDVGAMMALQAPGNQLELIVNVHPEVPRCVLGDPQRVRQCLVNLVGNAIKFTAAGEVVVDVAVLGHHEGRALVHFEVRDTGIGIAQETLPTLFQPFVQADSSTTRHFGGTGLGLSIVRRLAEMMGGTVGAASQLGVGSTFWFNLPMEEVAAAQDLPAPAISGPRARVLIVDDSRTCLEVLGTQLRHAGIEVACATQGAEALEMLSRRAFDLALIDSRLSGQLSGAALVRSIKTHPEASAVPLVLLTSLGKHDDTSLIETDIAARLSKPVGSGKLLACLQELLGERQPPAPDRAPAQPGNRRRYDARVLLTEDNPVNQKVATRFLQRLGLSVSIANNGAEACALFAAQGFDAILMDLQMPLMDGLSATRAIRQSETATARRPTPIIALTANAMAGQHESCLAAGMNAFLTKPLDIERLADILDQYLPSKPIAPEEVDATLAQPQPAPGTVVASSPVDLHTVSRAAS